MKRLLCVGICLFVCIIVGSIHVNASNVSADSGKSAGTTLTIICDASPESQKTMTLGTSPAVPAQDLTGQPLSSGGTSANTSTIPAAVPEPSTLILLGLGIIGCVAMLRRKRLPA